MSAIFEAEVRITRHARPNPLSRRDNNSVDQNMAAAKRKRGMEGRDQRGEEGFIVPPQANESNFGGESFKFKACHPDENHSIPPPITMNEETCQIWAYHHHFPKV